MIKQLRKTYYCFLTIALLSGCIAGCGSSKPEDTQTETTAALSETTAETTVEATAEIVTEAVSDSQAATSHIPGQTTLTYIGHASIKIVTADGTVIYVDPYADGDYGDEADYLLITHAHDDHQPNAQFKAKPDAVVITYKEALHDGVYETFTFDNLTIEAVSAYNGNHDKNECVGYIITVDGVTIYHAGDTDETTQMQEFAARKLDYALFPIDGIDNMGPSKATAAADLVGAKYSIPIHANDDALSGKKKSDKFTPESRLVLECGETIVIHEQ